MSVAIDVKTVGNVIAGDERPAASGATFEKLAPATGEVLSLVARSDATDTGAAITAAVEAQPAWADRTVEERGAIVRRIAQLLERDREEVAAVVAAETGKSPRDARAETDGAIELGYFIAGEGRRFYGRTMPSAVPNRQAMTVRQPLGVAGLIIAANTPIANVAWKVFPALLCGNGAVLKASEDSTGTALAFELLVERAQAQKVGPDDEHDFGPVINEAQLEHMLGAVERAKAAGATVVTGGERLPLPGFYMAPTIVEGVAADAEIACTELFGPV